MKYLITGNSLMATINGNPYSLTSDHPQFNTIEQAILSGAPEDDVLALFNVANAASKFMAGAITADGGALYYKGAQIHGVVVDRILHFMAKGLPYQPLVRFLERLMMNPSPRSIVELYGFIEKNGLPITEDGFILGYKGVNCNMTDCHTGKIDNSIGKKPFMKRQDVDDNFRLLCSNGFHVGSVTYAKGFGAKTIIVKIDPAHVVSVPDAEDGDKMRVEGYEVVAFYQGTLPPHIAISGDPYKDESLVRRRPRCP
jgi:hypothetical protein